MYKRDCVTLYVVVYLGVNAYECEHGHPGSLRYLSESLFCCKTEQESWVGFETGEHGIRRAGEMPRPLFLPDHEHSQKRVLGNTCAELRIWVETEVEALIPNFR